MRLVVKNFCQRTASVRLWLVWLVWTIAFPAKSFAQPQIQFDINDPTPFGLGLGSFAADLPSTWPASLGNEYADFIGNIYKIPQSHGFFYVPHSSGLLREMEWDEPLIRFFNADSTGKTTVLILQVDDDRFRISSGNNPLDALLKIPGVTIQANVQAVPDTGFLGFAGAGVLLGLFALHARMLRANAASRKSAQA
jgi:hypothetical protein